jgi:serine/threonine protein kinase
MHTTGDLLQGRYEIVELLGQGGMGGVYLATHKALEARVAIKEMTLRYQSDDDRVAAVRQFKKEAQILHLLRHDHLPRVHDFFEENGKYYLVMDYIHGQTLEHYVATEPLSEVDVERFGRQLCSVLKYLHTHQPPIIFRDLKPSNIMLTDDGVLKLIDFGIAKDFDTKTGRGTQTSARGAGTPGFAAPEQYGSGSDVRTDVYALGATLYSLLTRLVPPDSVDVASGGAEFSPLLDLRPDLNPTTARVIEWMLSINRTLRPASIKEVEVALGYTDAARFSVLPQRVLDQVQSDADRYSPSATQSLPRTSVGTRPVLAGAARLEPVVAPPPAALEAAPAPLYQAPSTALASVPVAAASPASAPRGGLKWALAVSLALAAAGTGLVWKHLHPNTIVVHVTSQPPGASIVLNDKPYDRTPQDIAGLPATGSMHVELTLPGYQDINTSIPIQAHPAPFVMLPTGGVLRVSGTPPAKLEVDGKKTYDVGVDSDVLLLPGAHRLVVRSKGYYDLARSVELKPGQQSLSFQYSLKPCPVTLSLLGVPHNATIEFGHGKYHVSNGTTPMVAKVVPGVYPLHIQAAGYETFDSAVSVTAGGNNAYHCDLKRSADADVAADSCDPTTPQATVTLAPPSPALPAQSVPLSGPAPPTNHPTLGWTVVPGQGIGPVVVRQPAEATIAQYHLRLSKGPAWWLGSTYVGSVSGTRSLRVFVANNQVAGVAVDGALVDACHLPSGLTGSSSEADIVGVLGAPQRRVHGALLEYSNGVMFRLGNSRLTGVFVFDPDALSAKFHHPNRAASDGL